MLIESVHVKGVEEGTNLLVLGAVHGNEKCGTYAINRIIKEISAGDLKIKQGRVTFVPICNKAAFDQDVRYIGRNLNRFLIPHENPQINEEKIGNELCPLLENCDVLLDLHSYTVGGASFVFVGNPHTPEHEFANCLGAAVAMTGWSEAYAQSGRQDKKTDPNESIGTTEYARRFGAIAVTLECGQHKAPEGPEIAYLAIRRALAYLKMADFAETETKQATNLVDVKKVFYRPDAGGGLSKAWKNLETVGKDEIIAKDSAGNPITAPDDGYIILPHADTIAGTEWFYWGKLLSKLQS